MLHREALAVKRVGSMSKDQNYEKSELENVFSDVVEIVNSIKLKPKQSRQFTSFCEDAMANQNTLLLHSQVRWLSRGNVMDRFLKLKDEVCDFLKQQDDSRSSLLEDNLWLARLNYLSSIFNIFNELNVSMQGNGGDVFVFYGKIEALKRKLIL